MAQLEARLVIGATDNTSTAFKSIRSQIASIDKSIATFNKLAAEAGKVGKSTDGVIGSIAKSTAALNEQKAAVTALSEKLAASAGSADEAASGQRALGEATEATTRVMIAQGAKAAEIAGQIVRAQEKTVTGAKRAKGEAGLGVRAGEGAAVVGGSMGGIAGMLVGGEVIHAGVESLKASADLEQLKVKVRGASGGNEAEQAFAEKLAAEVAAKYPVITQAKALDTYLELRNQALIEGGKLDEAKARRNLMATSRAQVAAVATGVELTPEDAQSLVKVVEGTGQANDPQAVSKVLDLYIRGKQVFGSALTAEKMRDFVQNAKAAAISMSDQSFVENMVRMTEGNSSRLGNEVAQTMQTLVGGHMQKQTAEWLVKRGLASGLTSMGGGHATVTDLKGSNILQVDGLEWANKVLLPFIKSKGALSEKNVEARMKLFRDEAKRSGEPAPNEEVLREKAEHSLIAAAISGAGWRTTVADYFTHSIANERLVQRDVGGMGKAAGAEQAAALISQNPVAAFQELTNSFENLATTVVSPAVKAISPYMDELSNAMARLAATVADVQKNHPEAAPVLGAAAIGGGAWLGWKLFTGTAGLVGRAFGLGGGGAAAGGAAAAGGEAVAAASTAGPIAAGLAALGVLAYKLWNADPKTMPEANRRLAQDLGLEPKPTMMGPFLPAASRVSAAWPNQVQDMEMAMRAERAFRQDPEAAHGRAYHQLGGANVSFTGQADVQQTLHLDVTLDPGLKAKLDAMPDFTYAVPLAPLGVMDDDASPRRAPGTGHM